MQNVHVCSSVLVGIYNTYRNCACAAYRFLQERNNSAFWNAATIGGFGAEVCWTLPWCFHHDGPACRPFRSY